VYSSTLGKGQVPCCCERGGYISDHNKRMAVHKDLFLRQMAAFRQTLRDGQVPNLERTNGSFIISTTEIFANIIQHTTFSSFLKYGSRTRFDFIMYLCIYLCIYLFMYLFIYLCIYLCIYLFVY
jgi:hypothetical protein